MKIKYYLRINTEKEIVEIENGILATVDVEYEKNPHETESELDEIYLWRHLSEIKDGLIEEFLVLSYTIEE